MISITLTPEQIASVLAQNGSAPKPPPPPMTDIPPGVVVIDVPWELHVGTQTAKINRNTLAFKVIPQDTHFNSASFVISPTTAADYFEREFCLSEKPGAFDGLVRGDGRIYFTAGASYPLDKYGRLDTRYPCLNPGQPYYLNVRQKNPSLICRINYALTPA
jgi:hypothetical protein